MRGWRIRAKGEQWTVGRTRHRGDAANEEGRIGAEEGAKNRRGISPPVLCIPLLSKSRVSILTAPMAKAKESSIQGLSTTNNMLNRRTFQNTSNDLPVLLFRYGAL